MTTTTTTTASSSFQIHAESRGPHWIAWISRGDDKPYRSVVLVGASREEAEANARRWAERQTG